jgi:hypothetical protein
MQTPLRGDPQRAETVLHDAHQTSVLQRARSLADTVVFRLSGPGIEVVQPSAGIERNPESACAVIHDVSNEVAVQAVGNLRIVPEVRERRARRGCCLIDADEAAQVRTEPQLFVRIEVRGQNHVGLQ